MANLYCVCAMLHMTSSHNTEGDGDTEGRIQPGKEAGDIVI